jgi:hypothetical protein
VARVARVKEVGEVREVRKKCGSEEKKGIWDFCFRMRKRGKS